MFQFKGGDLNFQSAQRQGHKMNGAPENFEAKCKINIALAATLSNFVFLCTVF
jgi:hypothetical protein